MCHLRHTIRMVPWTLAFAAVLLIGPSPANAGQSRPDRSSAPASPSFLLSETASWAAAAFGGDHRIEKTAAGGWPIDRPPFSFIYGGESSRVLLGTWARKTERRALGDIDEFISAWTDPRTGLRVTATARSFKNYPAVEWILRFENTGSQDSPILEKVNALDIAFQSPATREAVLDQINGDDCSQKSFFPVERPLRLGETVALAPVGGRPSNGTFPFVNFQCGGEGVFTAIGWTGQWSAEWSRAKDGSTHVRAGMELTHLRLHAGETIRTPRIMLLRWSGDRIDAHNTFRRLLLAHYLPQIDGRPAAMAVSAQTFNRTGGKGYWASEPGQLAAARVNRDLGCDTLWFDAGWFEGNFPDGVGNWTPKAKEFPRGLGPIGEECEKLGIKFLVWYEPERVAPGTRILREHPEFLLLDKSDPRASHLFNLGDPAARRWLTDLLNNQIAEFHIHTYRNDFNIDPLSFWRRNDPPDRQGITEIRYVEGLYAMLDEMRARHPHMVLDDCASGGRRIDLEMLSRAVVQTRSDSACTPGRSDWDQCQSYGLNLYLPLHATIGWDVGAYECRSSATAGFVGEWDILSKSFPMAEARASIAEINANRKYWIGDYYPLTPCAMTDDVWMAWQLDRRDLDEGIVLAFRRKACPQSSLAVKLRGPQPDRLYTVSFIGDDRRAATLTKTGRELASLRLELPSPQKSLLVRYVPKSAPALSSSRESK